MSRDLETKEGQSFSSSKVFGDAPCRGMARQGHY